MPNGRTSAWMQPMPDPLSVVVTLADGRLFVPDLTLTEAPELAAWFATACSYYWQRDFNLQGYVLMKRADA